MNNDNENENKLDDTTKTFISKKIVELNERYENNNDETVLDDFWDFYSDYPPEIIEEVLFEKMEKKEAKYEFNQFCRNFLHFDFDN